MGMTRRLKKPDVVRPATRVMASGCHVPGTRASGIFPIIVVNDVRKIGSKRDLPASIIASWIFIPVERFTFILSIRTMELFITIPKSATRPISDGNESADPVTVRPKNTPIRERGIGAKTKRDCRYELNWRTIVPTTRIMPNAIATSNELIDLAFSSLTPPIINSYHRLFSARFF